MFHPERDLRLMILDVVKDDGKSISAISRELDERGFGLHRLILTGYLRAMTDLGVLREREVPPSKIYIPVKGNGGDAYRTLGDIARSMAANEETAARLILFSLYRLFRRAIFQEELERAGLKSQPPGRTATREERQEAKQALVKTGFKVPDSSKAYILDDPSLEPQYCELLARALVIELDISYLTRETKQTKLTL